MNNIEAEDKNKFFETMAKIGWVAKFDKCLEIVPLLNAAKQAVEELEPLLDAAAQVEEG